MPATPEYGPKYPKAVATLVRDADALLTFFDFPAEHWKYLRTSNVIESLFATVRLSQHVTKGAGSRTKGLLMQLERLARSLERTHPGAAASLREGLDETLTLQRLGIRGTLYRTLSTTNPVENLNGSVTRFTRNVKRWRDRAMVVRWVATGVRGAEHRFRRVRGFREMPRLVAALRQHQARGVEAVPASGVSGATVGRGG